MTSSRRQQQFSASENTQQRKDCEADCAPEISGTAIDKQRARCGKMLAFAECAFVAMRAESTCESELLGQRSLPKGRSCFFGMVLSEN